MDRLLISIVRVKRNIESSLGVSEGYKHETSTVRVYGNELWTYIGR